MESSSRFRWNIPFKIENENKYLKKTTIIIVLFSLVIVMLVSAGLFVGANDVTTIHNGYFSQDKKGVFKDTKGDTTADYDTYNTIMKDKEWLLSYDCPLRFIFSHSALKEGWDNPNVFQICTLIDQKNTFTCRQKVGRGLRLCVDQTGERIEDKNINILHVMANESFAEFAETLQKEIETETGDQITKDLSFANYCKSFGWIDDNGESFKEQYCCNSYDEALEYLPKVMDISLLGNLIFSYWQHLNANKENFNSKNWFVKTLTRLKQLL